MTVRMSIFKAYGTSNGFSVFIFIFYFTDDLLIFSSCSCKIWNAMVISEFMLRIAAVTFEYVAIEVISLLVMSVVNIL